MLWRSNTHELLSRMLARKGGKSCLQLTVRLSSLKLSAIAGQLIDERLGRCVASARDDRTHNLCCSLCTLECALHLHQHSVHQVQCKTA